MKPLTIVITTLFLFLLLCMTTATASRSLLGFATWSSLELEQPPELRTEGAYISIKLSSAPYHSIIETHPLGRTRIVALNTQDDSLTFSVLARGIYRYTILPSYAPLEYEDLIEHLISGRSVISPDKRIDENEQPHSRVEPHERLHVVGESSQPFAVVDDDRLELQTSSHVPTILFAVIQY